MHLLTRTRAEVRVGLEGVARQTETDERDFKESWREGAAPIWRGSEEPRRWAAPGLASARAQSAGLEEQLPDLEIPGSISAPSQPLPREGTGSLLLSEGGGTPLSASGLSCMSSCSALGGHLRFPRPGADPPGGVHVSTCVGITQAQGRGNSVIPGSPLRLFPPRSRRSLPRGLDGAPLLCAPSMPLTSPLCNAHQASGNCKALF